MVQGLTACCCCCADARRLPHHCPQQQQLPVPCCPCLAADGIPSQRYVTATLPVMQKLTGLGTCPPSMLAAEVSVPQPADLLRTPPGQLTRVLALDGIQVGGICNWREPLRLRYCKVGSALNSCLLARDGLQQLQCELAGPTPCHFCAVGRRQPGYAVPQCAGAGLAGRGAAARLLRPLQRQGHQGQPRCGVQTSTGTVQPGAVAAASGGTQPAAPRSGARPRERR